MSKIVIITPIFSGSGTGAAVYYPLLVKNLAEKGVKLTIISEKTQEKISIENCEYLGIFPTRSGKEKQIIRDSLGYGWQNILYLRLPKIVKKIQPELIIVHSSFYNLPGIFPQVMQKIMASGAECIIDVRDVLIPRKQVGNLGEYKKAIACSENVFNHLINCGLAKEKINYIPIPQEQLSVNLIEQEQLLLNLGLKDTPYIFYAGMIKELKAVDLLLEAFTEYVREKLPELVLVMAGYIKTSNQKIIKLLQEKNVCYVGNKNRKEVLQLMKGAKLCINLSPNEGMPRSSLEALALKCPVLLPPNVPEFMRFCPDFVVTSRQPKEIADQIIKVLESGAIPSYPIELHFPERVIREYEQVFVVPLD